MCRTSDCLWIYAGVIHLLQKQEGKRNFSDDSWKKKIEVHSERKDTNRLTDASVSCFSSGPNICLHVVWQRREREKKEKKRFGTTVLQTSEQL